MNQVTPYNQTQAKKEQVAQMFDNIAFRYDFLNSLLSMGIHKGWRKKAVKILTQKKPKYILDVASGTADFAIEALKTGAQKVVGVDISEGMLAVGKEKIKKQNLEKNIELQIADAEHLPFSNNTFDAVTVGFGVRNFEHLEAGLQDMLRVLKPGGTLVVIEFSKPSGFFSWIYKGYFKYVTPMVGKLFSKDSRAYSYLPESVAVFPYGAHFCDILQQCGYQKVYFKKLTLGIACIYVAEK
ncbi:MAG: bifunctional demethylmenaquinone methyltransferase/2-methoxy-6-polyprenyl-1,4-benzoquinol methylase UbiE [Bacteroidetes bacterium]|nr:bifunctional demethylmenaquinone methyltransferase/2-methoxy-6-polyprenyl-1,4-benzoquinol methylase UbiE [Bacteroidota bacterium]